MTSSVTSYLAVFGENSIFRACEGYNSKSFYLVFTKLDMIDNQVVLSNFIERRNHDVIRDVTVDHFMIEFGIFRVCENNNSISPHLMFTKDIDIVVNQVVLFQVLIF